MAPASAPLPHADGDASVTVMSRNIYLGAEIGPALELLPDLQAAGQLLWDQVRATDFEARAPLLAQEIVAARPDVVGLQEATRWICRSWFLGRSTVVLDFTELLLGALASAGAPYAIAATPEGRAVNPSFSIGPLPGVSMRDPETFQPLFGRDTAECGFEVADVLLVRDDLTAAVQRVGTSEYEAAVSIVPTVLIIERGYAWADVAVAGTTVRFVTTHLESQWEYDAVPPAAEQARQLVEDLALTTVPLVVVGDFNSDYRDPRPAAAVNPAEQPQASPACPAQASEPTVQAAEAGCSAYWTMRQHGYFSAGPDDFAAGNATYGASALLAGPDPDRLRAGLELGNPYGFTDRLDYVWVRNGAGLGSAGVVGQQWPDDAATWPCTLPAQVTATAEAGAILVEAGRPAPAEGVGVCLPSDHAGVVATLQIDVSASVADDPLPIAHDPYRLAWWHLLAGLVLLIAAVVAWRVVRRRRAGMAPAATSTG